MTRFVEKKVTSEDLEQQVVALMLKNKLLRESLAILKAGLFGKNTERLSKGQLDFFKSAEDTSSGQELKAFAPSAPTKPIRSSSSRDWSTDESGRHDRLHVRTPTRVAVYPGVLPDQAGNPL